MKNYILGIGYCIILIISLTSCTETVSNVQTTSSKPTEISYEGVMLPYEEVQVGRGQTTVVKKVVVQSDQIVKKGQVLAQLEDRTIRDQIKKLKLQIQQKNVEMNIIKEQSRPKEDITVKKELLEAETALKKANFDYEEAKRSKEEGITRLQNGAISNDEYVEVLRRFEEMHIQYVQAQKQYDLLNKNEVTKKEPVDELKLKDISLQKKLFEFELKQLEQQLQTNQIVSPITGKVQKIQLVVEEGKSTPIFTITNEEKMILKVKMNPKDSNALLTKDTISVSVKPLLSQPIVGNIEEISLNEEKNELELSIIIPNPQNKLEKGMTGKIKIP